MAETSGKNLKRYYTIKEVAQMFSLNESTLRYWESEFPSLCPRTVGQNVRQYQEKDIELIRLIHNLVKVRGFKLAAARKMISANRGATEKSVEVLNSLIAVRDELKALNEALGRL